MTDIFFSQQLRPYLLGETEIQPSVIDPNGPIPVLKETSLLNNKRVQEKVSASSTATSTRLARNRCFRNFDFVFQSFWFLLLVFPYL